MVKYQPKPNASFFLLSILAMKADESADCAGRRGGRLSTGLRFFF
jgi:hypothetical protein